MNNEAGTYRKVYLICITIMMRSADDLCFLDLLVRLGSELYAQSRCSDHQGQQSFPDTCDPERTQAGRFMRESNQSSWSGENRSASNQAGSEMREKSCPERIKRSDGWNGRRA